MCRCWLGCEWACRKCPILTLECLFDVPRLYVRLQHCPFPQQCIGRPSSKKNIMEMCVSLHPFNFHRCSVWVNINIRWLQGSRQNHPVIMNIIIIMTFWDLIIIKSLFFFFPTNLIKQVPTFCTHFWDWCPHRHFWGNLSFGGHHNHPVVFLQWRFKYLL